MRLRQSDAAQRSEDTEGVSDAASLEGSGVPLKQVLTNIITFKATGHIHIYIYATHIHQLPQKSGNSYMILQKTHFFQSGTGIVVPAHSGTKISTWACYITAYFCHSLPFWLQHLPLVDSTGIAEVQLMFTVHFWMMQRRKIKKQTTFQHPIPLHLWTSRKIHLLERGLLREKNEKRLRCQNHSQMLRATRVQSARRCP